MKVQTSPKSGSEFFNYEHSFFIVLLALVDAHYRFTIRRKGSCGRNSGGWGLLIQNLGKCLEAHLSVPEDKPLSRISCFGPRVIFGDTFPLKTYLMRVYPCSQSKGNNESSNL